MPASLRLVALASVLAIVLVASAAFAGPLLLRARDARAIEPASLVPASAVTQAIDAASAPLLAALVPGSEPHTRATTIITGEKEAANDVAIAASAADLEVVKAVAAGAIESAGEFSTTDLATDELAALRADARGWMRGVLASLAAAEPGPGVADAMRAATDGLLVGATSAYDETHPATDAAAHVRWASAAAEATFESVTAEASTFAGAGGSILGAPWLPFFAEAASSAAEEATTLLPDDASASTLDALGASTGGELAGMLAGLAGALDGEAPGAALSESLLAWYDGISAGAYGAEPWGDDEATLDALALWTSALAESGSTGLAEILAPPEPAVVEAWGGAIAGGGVARIAESQSLGADAHAALAAYAGALSDDALTYLAGVEDPSPAFLAAVSAWGDGMTAGVGLVKGPTDAELVLLGLWIEGLATTAADLPFDSGPAELALVRAFAEGATAGPVALIGTLGTFPATSPDPLLLAFTGALGAARDSLLDEPAPAVDPALLTAFVSGLSTGFLSDPHLVFADAKSNRAAVGALLAGAFDAGGANLLWATSVHPDDTVRDFGDALGQAMTEWLDPRSEWAIDFAETAPEFLTGWATGTVEAGLDALENAEIGFPPGPGSVDEARRQAERYGAEVEAYALAVLRHAEEARALLEGAREIGQGARAYARVAMTPVGWLDLVDPEGEMEAARAFLEGFVAEADPARLGAPGWAERAIAIAEGTGRGVADGLAPAEEAALERGDLALAWVKGVGEALGTAPLPGPASRIEAWARWAETASEAAIAATEAGSAAELALAERLAVSLVENVTTTDPGEPDLDAIGAPLEAWARSTLGYALARLPDGVDAPTEDAFLAYVTGVQDAVSSFPSALPDGTYLAEETAAALAWADGISAGADVIAGDVEAIARHLVDCACEPPQDVLLAYAENLGAWAEAATRAGLEAIPSTDPTTEGIEAIRAWADALDPTSDPLAFAEAQRAAIEAHAEIAAAGVPIVAGYQPIAEDSADTMEAYLRGVAAGAGEHFFGAPIGDPDDPWDLTWTVALLDAITKPGGLAPGKLTEPDALNAHYAFVAAATLGGYDAAGAGFDASVDQTETLSLFAEALVASASPTLAALLDEERAAVLAYARGAAQGSVEAIRGAYEAGRGVPTGERDELVRFAEWLMTFDSSWLPAGPPTGNPPDLATETWRAHAEALGEAILDLPTAGTEQRLAEMLLRADAVRAAALAAPAIGADPELARQWTLATLRGALETARVVDPERPVDPDPALAQAYLAEFTAETLASLPTLPLANDRVQDAGTLVLAAMETRCEGDVCGPIGTILGIGAGLALLDDTLGEDATPDDREPVALPQAEGAAQGVVDALASDGALRDQAAAVAAARGALAGVLEDPTDAANARDAAQAAVEAALAARDSLSPDEVAALAHALADALTPAPFGGAAGELHAWAGGAADAAVAAATRSTGSRVEAIRNAVAGFFASGGSGAADPEGPTDASVEASDGTSTHAGRDLDGEPWLSGLAPNVVTVAPPPGLGGTWQLLLLAENGATAAALDMTPANGRHAGSVPVSFLDDHADGSTLGFVLRHRGPAGTTTLDRDGEPWSYRLDQRAPTLTLDAPASSESLTFPIAIPATDGAGSGLRGTDVWIAKNAGEFEPLVEGTRDDALSFTGENGVTYRIRARATDAVGHASPWTDVAETTIRVPAGSSVANHAPTVAFLAPTPGSRYAGPFEVKLDLADPDGTTPLVTVLAMRPGTTEPLATLYAGASRTFTVDPTTLPDGKLELRALATDGTKRAEASSGVIALDRAGPLVRGVSVRAAGDAMLVTVVLDDAARATLDVLPAAGGAPVAAGVKLTDDGANGDPQALDGAWTARVTLGDGAYRFAVVAADELGNEANRAVNVAIAPPPAPTPPTPAIPTPEPTPSEPAVEPREPVETAAPPARAPPPATAGEAASGGFGIPAPGLLAVALGVAVAARARKRGT